MKATSERTSGSRVVLDVEVPPDEMAEEIDAATRRLARRVRIPGFRPGKAPIGLVERAVGRPRILQEALQPLVARAYRDAVRQEALEPIADPDIEVREYEDGAPLHFVATVPVRPEVRLGDYAAVRGIPEERAVEDADVDAALQEMRRERGVWAPSTEPAADGDLVTLQVAGRLSDGRNVNERGIQGILGSGQIRPAVEAAVRGLAAGGEAEVELSFPPEDASPALRGRSGRFTVQVLDVKRLDVPELDDAFAKECSSADTVEELRLQVRNRLSRDAESAARLQALDGAVREIVDGAELELPDLVVEEALDLLVAQMRGDVLRRGMRWEDYLAAQEGGLEAVRTQLRGAAERQARTRLVLMALAREVDAWPTEAQVTAEVDRLAARSGLDPVHFRRRMAHPERLATVAAQLARRAGLRWVAEHCLPAGQGDAAADEALGGELGALVGAEDAGGPDPEADGPSGEPGAADGGAAG